MKTTLLLITTFFTLHLQANEIIFQGQMEGSNKDCQVSYRTVNEEYNLNAISFKSEDINLSFLNSPIFEGNLPPVTKGLFTYSNGRYSPIVGIPIFAIGRYYRVEMQKTENDILLNVDTMLAGVFDWIKKWSKTYRCF